MNSRRSFLLEMGVAAVASQELGAQTARVRRGLPDILRAPDGITALSEGRAEGIRLARSGDRWQGGDIEVAVVARKDSLVFTVGAPKTRLTRLRIRWHCAFPEGTRFLGDHWERSYGDLEWRGLAGERLMPWYFLASRDGVTTGYGVKTGAASICSWQADGGGVTLWLDVRNGGSGVELGARRLEAATLVVRKGRAGESASAAARAFCGAMSERPLLAAKPIYGSNNWYYAYGRNVSAAGTLKDAALMAELMPKGGNAPFAVIDMGWGAAREGAGPAAQSARSYPDMPGLAKQMKDLGVRPGIWTRPTLTTEKRAEEWRLPAAGGRPKGELIAVDPSIPEALAYMKREYRDHPRVGVRADQARFLDVRFNRQVGLRNGARPDGARLAFSGSREDDGGDHPGSVPRHPAGGGRRRPDRLQYDRAPGGGTGGGAEHR